MDAFVLGKYPEAHVEQKEMIQRWKSYTKCELYLSFLHLKLSIQNLFWMHCVQVDIMIVKGRIYFSLVDFDRKDLMRFIPLGNFRFFGYFHEEHLFLSWIFNIRFKIVIHCFKFYNSPPILLLVKILIRRQKYRLFCIFW